MADSETLKAELGTYDGLDVAGLCGALQLLPDNAEHADRLVALAAAALAEGRTGARRAGSEELAIWLRDRPSLHAGPPWDPYEGPFCEPLNFVGGGYLLSPEATPRRSSGYGRCFKRAWVTDAR